MTLPPLDAQRDFWDGWNQSWRFRDGFDEFMDRQREIALECAEGLGLRGAKILEIGCGTGWLANTLVPFGQVTATDLSPNSIAEGQRRHPAVTLLCGDFLTLDLSGPFDFVLSADALAHMYDQPLFMKRVAELLRPGGTFLLMTQNPPIWARRSSLKPLGTGQIQIWPDLARIKALLAPQFIVEKVTSIVPGGDRGLLWWVENRYVRGGMRRLFGRRRWDSLLETARLGRELVIISRRR